MSKRCRIVRHLVPHRAFTLVELLVVIAIVGVLVSLLLPAVQYSRESSRRIACANNLRNQALALQNFHSAYNQFPAGRKWANGFDTSWYLELMPYLEQEALFSRYDRTKPWNDPAGNLAVSKTTLEILRCPSSVLRFPGDSDYGGMQGSALTASDWKGAVDNGILIEVLPPAGQMVRFASISDGASQTICIAESADRAVDSGEWINGANCFSHDNGSVSLVNAGEIFSQHRIGANVAFADGSTRFLTSKISPYVVGALCTRDLGETVQGSEY